MHLASILPLDACISTNGVINLASMSLTSDMTDWPFAEGLGEVPMLPPSPLSYKVLYSKSPLSRLNLIQCPVLLIAGGSDTMVLPSGSIEAYRILKVSNKKVKILWYPLEGHGILSKPALFDQLANSLSFLLTLIS